MSLDPLPGAVPSGRQRGSEFWGFRIPSSLVWRPPCQPFDKLLDLPELLDMRMPIAVSWGRLLEQDEVTARRI
jgi:hypothetical protein